MAQTKPTYKTRDDTRGQSLSDYWPLVSLIMVSALSALALNYGETAGLMAFMHYFMGFFLCSFAMLKLFNPDAFADGFEMYDVIAKRWRHYAYVYPYIELGLGLGYLSFFMPAFVYTFTIVIMLIGAIGVIKALIKGLDINCPCMGSVLNVPLSTVTLTEDIGMAIMALLMLALIPF